MKNITPTKISDGQGQGEKYPHDILHRTLPCIVRSEVDMQRIPLSQGKVALIDDEDFERVNSVKWYASKYGRKFYARGHYRKENKTRGSMSLHRFILNFPAKQEIDHRNGNPLDNRKQNLRICTHMKNCYNKSKYTNNMSGYKGIYWNKERKRWIPQIKASKKYLFIGRYKNKKDAVESLNWAIAVLHGEFAKLNPIPQEA